jgi:G3E family GTPase
LYCRDNGVKAIENLMEKRGKFDYVLLETRQVSSAFFQTFGSIF